MHILRGATRVKTYVFSFVRCIGRSRAIHHRKARMTEQMAFAAALHRTAAL